jgi:hypothetical protein
MNTSRAPDHLDNNNSAPLPPMQKALVAGPPCLDACCLPHGRPVGVLKPRPLCRTRVTHKKLGPGPILDGDLDGDRDDDYALSETSSYRTSSSDSGMSEDEHINDDSGSVESIGSDDDNDDGDYSLSGSSSDTDSDVDMSLDAEEETNLTVSASFCHFD